MTTDYLTKTSKSKSGFSVTVTHKRYKNYGDSAHNFLTVDDAQIAGRGLETALAAKLDAAMIKFLITGQR